MANLEQNNINIPKSHPRYESLKYRHKIIEGMKNLVVAEAGLIAHGRGECFDYILGERSNESAKKAIRAAVSLLLIAKRPIISVNGNIAALVPKELVKLSQLVKAPLEINLFYQKEGRIEAIKNILEKAGATNIRGILKDKMKEIEGLESNRRFVDAIIEGDVIFIPLEDGDRTEALKKMNKKIIAVDLNPISRTALNADITIVDNIIRVLPEMIKIGEKLKKLPKEELGKIATIFDNKKNIRDTLDLIIKYIKKQKKLIFQF